LSIRCVQEDFVFVSAADAKITAVPHCATTFVFRWVLGGETFSAKELSAFRIVTYQASIVQNFNLIIVLPKIRQGLIFKI
jgi:hypothetical protein